MSKDKVFLDKNNIISWIPENQSGDTEGTKTAFDVLESLITDHNATSILVDLSKAEKPSSEQRKIMVQRIKDNYDMIKKVALFGDTPLMKVVAYFIINASELKNIRFFSSRSQALTWLKD